MSHRWPQGAGRFPLPAPGQPADRSKLTSAAAEVVLERDYATMSVEHILVRAEVSRVAFYREFADKRECVLVAHDEAFDHLLGQLLYACSERLLTLEALAAEPTLASRVIASHDFFAVLLRAGREHWPRAAALPESIERVLVGAVVTAVGQLLSSGRADRLPELEPQLVRLVLMPYV